MSDLIRKSDALECFMGYDRMGDIKDAIAALPAVTVGVEWRKIETAPRGGEWFIARTEHGTTRVVRYADEYDRYPISHDGAVWSTAPTEWTPLKPVLAALEPVAAPRRYMGQIMAECDCSRQGECEAAQKCLAGAALDDPTLEEIVVVLSGWIDRLIRERVDLRQKLASLEEPVAAPNLKRIGTGLYETQPAPDPAAIREAWEKAYWRMRSYAVHDNDCKLNKPPRFDGPCSCGMTAALEEALALIQKGAADV